MAKYLINTSQTNVGLIEGKLYVPLGGWTEISDKDAENEHVDEAIRRGWVTITATNPDPAAGFSPNFEFEKPTVEGTTDLAEAKKNGAKKTKTEKAEA